jgi:ABC-type sugar transport system substrate-binding protein
MLNTHRTSGRRFAVASLVAVGLLVAACGSDDDASSSDTGAATDQSAPSDTGGSLSDTAADGIATGDAGSGDAAAVVAQYTTVPTEIVQTEPLSKAPDPKKVTFIVCADPSCVVLGDYLKDATTALGWEFTSINAPATDFGSAVQQAIDTQPDFIAGTGTDAAAFQPQYDAMQEAGIPYFTCYATDVPAGEENNLYAV